MITTSADTAALIESGTFALTCQVSVSYAGEVIATDVPVIAGREETDVSLKVPERVTLTVPRLVDGVSWEPTGARSPLAPYGQRLHVRLGVSRGNEVTEWLNRGEFLIHDTQVQGDTVSVAAVGLLELVDEARMISPYQPTGNILTAIRALIEPALTVVADPALVDRTVPAGVVIDDDRLQGVLDLLDAWPAVAQVTEDGYLRLVPPGTYEQGPTVRRFNDLSVNPALTPESIARVINTTGQVTRENLSNCVVARGTLADGAPVQAVAYDITNGPTRYRGPSNPLPVPFYFSSPLLTTAGQCRAAAATILARRQGPVSRSFPIDMIPDPRLQNQDLVTYVPERTEDATAVTVVDRLVMPYTATSGPMSVQLREVTL
jgi:hypothetical protein